MKSDRKTLYILSSILVLALVLALLLPSNSGRAITALLFVVFAVAIFRNIKKRPILSINKREVLLLISVMGGVYLVLYYLTGLYFNFYKSSTPLTINNFFKYILPITIIIISIEIIRYVLLAQNGKFVDVLAYVGGVATEFLIFSTLESITNFNRFMDAIGLTLFPAITANLLYNYISKRYGFAPNIAYRLITTLYVYIIPVYPSTPDSLFAFAKLIVPLLIYMFFSALYGKQKRIEKRKSKIVSYGVTTVAIAIMISIVMLISCQFRYRSIVIATESMTGEINKGDAIVYEAYDDQIIKEGDVIVFRQNKSLVVHRVMEIQRIDGRNRYFTKGDANEERDEGYILDGHIEGVVCFKVAYVGYPSIWMRDLFKK